MLWKCRKILSWQVVLVYSWHWGSTNWQCTSVPGRLATGVSRSTFYVFQWQAASPFRVGRRRGEGRGQNRTRKGCRQRQTLPPYPTLPPKLRRFIRISSCKLKCRHRSQDTHWGCLGLTWHKGTTVLLPWGGSGSCLSADGIQRLPFWCRCSSGCHFRIGLLTSFASLTADLTSG